MRPEVFIISTSAVLALLMRANTMVTVLLNVGRIIFKKKRISLGMDLNLISVEVNHKPAKDYEEHVKHYLQEEVDHGAILGPFKSKPIDLHISLS